MIVYASKFGFRFKGSHPGGAGAVRRLRGHNVRSKALSVTLTRDTSPGVRGFKLVYFTPVNSRLSFQIYLGCFDLTFCVNGLAHHSADGTA